MEFKKESKEKRRRAKKQTLDSREQADDYQRGEGKRDEGNGMGTKKHPGPDELRVMYRIIHSL